MSAARTHGPSRVLIVDDRPDNLVSMSAVLAEGPWEIVLARSGEEALDAVLGDDFACIILDVAMPGMDGFETARLIKDRERSRTIPIIFVTASVLDIEHVFEAYQVGAVDYLQKPVQRHALRAKVSAFVALREQAHEIERQAQDLKEAEHRERRLLERRASEEAQRRLRALEALDLSEARFRILDESGLIGVVYFELDGMITGANETFWSLVGLRESQAPSLLDLVREEARAAEQRELEDLRAADVLPIVEKRLLAADGSDVFVLMGRAVLSRLEKGTGVGFVVDVTRRKRVELERGRILGQLREAVRARDEFLSMAAHELKTPLTPLRLQLDLLSRAVERGEVPPVSSIARMTRSERRLEKLVSELLDVSRLTAGKLRLDPERFDLASLVTEVVERWRSTHEQAEIRLSVPDHPLIGVWDRLRIDQVVENLVSNALKYGEGRPVDVVLAANGRDAILRVRDRGAGIPPDAQQRIFERFERAGAHMEHEGFGLGLWIARQAVEAHGGGIGVESQPGEGSEFTVVLPLEPTLPMAAPDVPAAAE